MNLNNYKNIFLDRDGIVNDIILRGRVVSSPRSLAEFKFRDDFLSFAKEVDKRKNFYLITNQPDIKRNLLEWVDLKSMNDKVMNILPFKGVFVCPHDNEDNCSCRKPKPGMILDAISKNNLKYDECLMIGDSLKDIEAANSAGISSFMLSTKYNRNVEGCIKISSLMSLI